MHSCFYHGYVRHQRSKPVSHGFRYPLFLAYIDLAELDCARSACRLLNRRYGPAYLEINDHPITQTIAPKSAAPSGQAWADSIRRLVQERSGCQVDGPIRVLTLLRSWGYYFSPLNIYFCFEPDHVSGCESAVSQCRLQAIVAEVSNTPWRETHYYVLAGDALKLSSSDSTDLTASHEKTFHVSPFMDMGSRYEWQIAIPRDTLDVKLISHNPKHPFVADLQLRRQPMRQNTLLKLLLRHPCMPGQIAARIYYQALLLWWKRCPFFPYPQPKLDEKQRATAARNKPMTKTRQT